MPIALIIMDHLLVLTTTMRMAAWGRLVQFEYQTDAVFLHVIEADDFERN